MDGAWIMTKKPIGCSKIKNYLTEKQRMTEPQKDGICKLECADCPLGIENNGMNIPCTYVEVLYPEKAIAIVQKTLLVHR